MGFSVPLEQWLRTEIKELAEKVIFSSKGGLSDYFNMQYIQNLWNQHQTESKYYSAVIWSLLMCQMWWNAYMAQESSEA